VAYTVMSKQQRKVCEFLALHPGSTSAEVMAGTGFTYDSTKKKLRTLRESGHVKGSESNYRATYQLTGKQFPRLEDYQPHPRYLAAKERMVARETGADLLVASMHAMVSLGRAAA
jgi:predicted transcriptional regulator